MSITKLGIPHVDYNFSWQEEKNVFHYNDWAKNKFLLLLWQLIMPVSLLLSLPSPSINTRKESEIKTKQQKSLKLR